ncbi:hypothetical protein HYS31_04600 [Candidatus Woesearchaeota archaeon]|nr:hypothetical protein [Candidatus Woesearchaeota archaeon]
MDPFEYFLDFKPKIELDESFMRNLRVYAFTDPTLLRGYKEISFLDKGTNHYHYRIGKVGNLWLATRQADDWYPDFQRADCESYIDDLVSMHNKLVLEQQEGKRVPVICGCVKAERQDGLEQYFLLVEDLTAGGTSSFFPGRRRDRSGMVDGVEVYYDFDVRPNFDSESYKYAVDGKMIVLRK